MLNRSPERANNDLRIINEMKRTLDAKKEANKADDFQDICTALAVDIVEIVKKEKSTDDLALTCTTHPRDIKLLSPQMQSFIESIKNERNLCILMKLYFPEKSFIERLPLLMSLYHLRSEEIEALKIFLKNDVSLSEREIKNIVQRFNILQRKYYNSHDVMPPS